MWCRVDIVLADVSEKRIASIFRVEGKKSVAPAHAGSLADFFLSSTLKPSTSETSVNTISTRHHT
jgi:hypothetical protein